MEDKINEIIRVQKDNSSAYSAINVRLDDLTKSELDLSKLVHDHLNAESFPAKELKKNISKVKDLRGQFLRAEKMSTYTEINEIIRVQRQQQCIFSNQFTTG